jgi:hypothetical protein
MARTDASTHDDVAAVDDLLADLRTAEDRLTSVEARIADHGETTVERVVEAHDRATDLLDGYEERATGTGRETFKNYVEFQEAFLELTEGLPDDLPHRDAFEAANDGFDKRRLSESDFARARDLLEPVAEIAALPEERTDARSEVRDARSAIRRRLSTLSDRIADLERLQSLGEVDLDAPVERLRNPIEDYDAAVREAFADFRREGSAREVLAFVAETEAFPLVDFRLPPDDLRAYVTAYPAGEESVSQLLEYVDYSQSKLSHYVDDPGALRARVATHRTYLERLDAEPLTVGWPPPDAASLRWRLSELVAVVGRFAPESVVARLRDLRPLTEDETEYARLRRAAEARAELGEAERERLASGAVADELAACRTARERLTDALDDGD